jgi:hypothetical protein
VLSHNLGTTGTTRKLRENERKLWENCEEMNPREKTQKIRRAEKEEKSRSQKRVGSIAHSFRRIAFLSQVGAHFL